MVHITYNYVRHDVYVCCMQENGYNTSMLFYYYFGRKGEGKSLEPLINKSMNENDFFSAFLSCHFSRIFHTFVSISLPSFMRHNHVTFFFLALFHTFLTKRQKFYIIFVNIPFCNNNNKMESLKPFNECAKHLSPWHIAPFFYLFCSWMKLFSFHTNTHRTVFWV